MKRSYSKPSICIISLGGATSFLSGSGGRIDDVYIYRGSTEYAEAEKEYWTPAEKSFIRNPQGIPQEDGEE